MNKKPPKKKSLKRRATSSTESVAKLKQTIAAQAQEIREGAERQNATSEILRLIARSPTDVQSVMDTIAESAARLCDADDAVVRRLEGGRFYAVSHYGAIPMVSGIGVDTLCDRSTPAGRAVLDKQTIHVRDLHAAASEYPGALTRGLKVGVRTALAAPIVDDVDGPDPARSLRAPRQQGRGAPRLAFLGRCTRRRARRSPSHVPGARRRCRCRPGR